MNECNVLVKVNDIPVQLDKLLSADMDSNQVVKKELNDLDFITDVKIEEEPLEVNLKQEIEPCINLFLSDNSQNNVKIDHQSRLTGETRTDDSSCDKCNTPKDKVNLIHRKLDRKTAHRWIYCDKCNAPLRQRKYFCECSLCGKSFSQTRDLVCHLKTHTGEELYNCYKCSQCGKKEKDIFKLRGMIDKLVTENHTLTQRAEVAEAKLAALGQQQQTVFVNIDKLYKSTRSDNL